MNENKTVNVPVRWILGDAEEGERVYLHSEWMELRDHFDWPDVRSMLEGDGVKFGESGCYTGETILGLFDQTINDCDPECAWDLSDVVVQVYKYHDFLEVVVLESFATKREVIAFLVMGSDDWVGQGLADIEPDVVRAMTKWSFIESVSM